MRTIILLMTILISGLAINAQTSKPTTPSKVKTCDIGIDSAPVIRGLRLGMSEKEIDELLGPDLHHSLDNNGLTRYTLAMPYGRAGFEGIESLLLSTFDNKLYKLDAQYAANVRWKNVIELIDNFSPKLGLPEATWTIDTDYSGRLSCRNFNVELDSMRGIGLKLVDRDALGKIAEAKATAEELKKKAIKP